MSESGEKNYTDFTLPTTIVTKVDLSRLVSEVERIDNELTTEAVRAKVNGQAVGDVLMSDQLTEFLRLNEIDLQVSQVRTRLIKQLRQLKDVVPVLHMTFSVTADTESLQQIIHWLRESVHPQAVISVGLQPALVAGVYLRTPNHVRDFSLRAMLAQSHGGLVKELEALRGDR